jgi:hypothetical protein
MLKFRLARRERKPQVAVQAADNNASSLNSILLSASGVLPLERVDKTTNDMNAFTFSASGETPVTPSEEVARKSPQY